VPLDKKSIFSACFVTKAECTLASCLSTDGRDKVISEFMYCFLFSGAEGKPHESHIHSHYLLSLYDLSGADQADPMPCSLSALRQPNASGLPAACQASVPPCTLATCSKPTCLK